MLLRQFDNDIFIPLVIAVGMPYDYLTSTYNNEEKGHEGDWDKEEVYEDVASCVNLVSDKSDEGNYKILWRFQSKSSITMQTIAHEAFHVAMSMCQFHGMALGFNVGEDEHAAHIAGWAGKCLGRIWEEINKEEEEKDANDEKE